MIRVDELPPPRPGSVFPPGWHETVGSSGAGKAMNLARLARRSSARSRSGPELQAWPSNRPSSPPPTCLRIRSPISPELTYCQRKNRNAIPKQTTSQPASTAKQTHNGEKGVPSTITWRRASPR